MQSIVLVISSSVFFSAAVSMALLTLASNFSSILTENVDVKYGANVQISQVNPSVEESLKMYLEEAKRSGEIDEYSKITNGFGGTLRSGSNMQYADYFGLWDSKYPVLGNLILKDTSKTAYEMLSNDSELVLSKELAQQMEVKLGDSIEYMSADYLESKSFNIVGLVESAPAENTSVVYLKGSVADDILSFQQVKYLIRGNEEIANELVNEFNSGISVTTLSSYIETNSNQFKDITTFLRSVSILGLFVGSIGIATSMSIVIARRKSEIGILKTLGYSKARVFTIFLTELVLIALIGDIIGIVVGFFFANYLKDIFTTVGLNYTMDMTFDMRSALIAFSASLFTAVLFSVVSIDNYVSLKPLNIIKDLPYKLGIKDKIRSVFVYIVIFTIFILLSIVITSSVTFGIGVVVISLVGFIIASLLMRVILALILKIPFKARSVIGLAWITLRSSYTKYVLASMSLFVGLTVLNLLFSLFSTANTEFEKRDIDKDMSASVVVYADKEVNTTDLTKYLNSNEAVSTYREKFRVRISDTEPQAFMSNVLEGREIDNYDWDIDIIEGEFNGKGIVINEVFKQDYNIGDTFTTQVGQKDYSFKISGFYKIDREFTQASIETIYIGAIISKDLFRSLFNEYQRVLLVSVDEENITQVSEDMAEYKGVVVMNSELTAQWLNSQLDLVKKLFTSTAGLALIAGIVLIINATSLEVVNRKRVFGIYKAIGFSSNQVRNMFMFEYIIILFITSFLSIASSYFIIFLINSFGDELLGTSQEIAYDFSQSIGIVTLSSLFILVLIYLVSRKMLNTKPVEILRYE